MKYPFQSLVIIDPKSIAPEANSPRIAYLIASAASSILVFNLFNGSCISQWGRTAGKEESESDKLHANSQNGSSNTGAPETDSTRKPSGAPEDAVETLKLVLTANQRHLVAVSVTKKSVLVFEVSEEGHLTLLSDRSLPKRPSGLTLFPDDSLIVCSDKFGDVYSLPLFQETSLNVDSDNSKRLSKVALFSASRPSHPAANDLTVHTGRNKAALQHQQQSSTVLSSKSNADCECSLLLGHISVITDVKAVVLKGPEPTTSRPRRYIITCDRDEHIRVSRGPPQTHVIESFCLGHASFVSRLSVSPWDPTVLLSGGGDECIYVWKWTEGRLMFKFNLSSHVQGYLENSGQVQNSHQPKTVEELKLSVSQILQFTSEIVTRPEQAPPTDTLRRGQYQTFIACEGISALFLFRPSAEGYYEHLQTIELDGNPVGLAYCSAISTLIVSIDTIHEKNTTAFRIEQTNGQVRHLQILQASSTSSGGVWHAVGVDDELQTTVNTNADTVLPELYRNLSVSGNTLSSSLYEFTCLRKETHGLSKYT